MPEIHPEQKEETMTPEQMESAEQVVAYGLDKLRALELQHTANAPAIFGELLAQLVAAELKAQRDEAVSLRNATRLADLIGAIWKDTLAPLGVTHALTLERVAALCQIERDGDRGADPDGNEVEESADADNGAESKEPLGP